MGLLGKFFAMGCSRGRGALAFERPYVWMAAACGLWLVGFGDYFTGHSVISSDAISYFDHTFYFVEHIKRGIFPLWDHTWNHGAPNDFFLRRIGCYNPLYVVMALFSLAGLSHMISYLLALSFYFFLGTFGFYLLAKSVYQDERVAFSAFLLLLFSTVGGRIFDSYMCLVIVPTIWFFYFSRVFLLAPRRCYFAGACLSFMIAMNTYIPLFFLTIVFVVGLFWKIWFPREAWEAGKKTIAFFRTQPVFSAILGGIVLLAMIPPAAFFLNSRQPSIVLHERHGASQAANVLSIDTRLLSWGIMEELFFTGYFTDFRRFLHALVYVPFWGIFLWALGGCCRINRRILFYVSVGIFFLLLGTPLAVPLHKFLYDHVFYFKYIRNLHFFLWFVLLPLWIFIAAEFLSQLLKMEWRGVRQKTQAASVVLLVMAGFLVFTLWRGDGVLTTFFVIVAGGALSLAYIFQREHFRGWVLWTALIGVIAPQAVEVFYFVSRNAPRTHISRDVPLPQFRYTTGIVPKASLDNECGSLYYSTSHFNDLCRNVSGLAFSSSLTHRLVAYGRVEPLEATAQGYARIDLALQKDLDVGFASGFTEKALFLPSERPERFTRDSGALSVAYFDTNTLIVRTDFPQDRFLVYADSYAKGWRALIDGKPASLYAANLAYKGVRVPAGRRVVEFRYGNVWSYLLNWLMLVVFNVLFWSVVISLWRQRREIFRP